ncbi:hypothetical protein H7H80_02370 [Mycobacterium interjectum]|nr:hypothetical protein [Mycobacterium interjectum]
MPSYDIEVTRDGRWWMIHIPAINGLTQARFPGEIEAMARDYIAVSTAAPVAEIEVRLPGGS